MPRSHRQLVRYLADRLAMQSLRRRRMFILSPLLCLERFRLFFYLAKTSYPYMFLCRQALLSHVFCRSSSASALQDANAASITNSAAVFDPRIFFDKNLNQEDIEKLRRALLYRSRQTGWLETDVIMVISS